MAKDFPGPSPFACMVNDGSVEARGQAQAAILPY
jgi:hypothetical protein